MTSIASTSPRSTSGRKRSLPPTSDREREQRHGHGRGDVGVGVGVGAERYERESRRDHRDRDDRDTSPPWWEQDRRGAGRGGNDSTVNDRRSYRDRRSTDGRNSGREEERDRDDYSRRSYQKPSTSSSSSSSGYYSRNGQREGGGGPGRQDDKYRHASSHYEDRSYTGDSTTFSRQNDRGGHSYRHDRGHGRGQGSYSPPSHSSRNDPDLLDYSDTPAPPKSDPSTLKKPNVEASLSTAAVSKALENGSTDSNKDKAPEPELELEIAAPIDPEAIAAERRRRRAEILAKYASTNNSGMNSEISTPTAERIATPEVVETEGRDSKRVKLETAAPGLTTATTPDTSITAAASPNAGAEDDDFELVKDADADAAARAIEQDASAHIEGEEEISAADYNPDEDRKNDDRRRAERDGGIGQPLVVKPEVVQGVDLMIKQSGEKQVVQLEDEDDDDDMFAIGTRPPKTVAEEDEDAGKPAFVPIIHRDFNDASGQLADNFDDADGYYKLILGELLDNGRYHVHANLGRGMFSSVVRAKDTESPAGEDVAIKIVRSQESMFKAGLKEAQILKKLQAADPDDKKHLIRLLRTFEHRGHLCLVFENLSMNLREVVKRFGKDVGINLKAVRAYASQMFLALVLLKRCDIMHADIKPDNILVNDSKSVLKVCDLGSASDVTENDITPYLVSRFYRAPEIILGMPYDCSLDVWSIACTLYELYTGKILFPGRSNNHMLLLIMELKGKFPHKYLKKGRFTDQHFDPSLNFISVEKDGTSLKTVALSSKAAHDLKSRLMPPGGMKKLKEDEAKLLGQFVDLLDKMLSLEPGKRPAPKDLLSHPFIKG